MKLTRLDLTRFGHFTDHALDLPAAKGIHVLFGRNAAGKSTIADGILYALFGWPGKRTERTYAFLHGTTKLRVGVTLQTDDGVELRMARRKGQGITVLDPTTNVASEELDARVTALLRGLTPDQWRNRYGLTQQSLRAGGARLQATGGDAGQALAAAQDGISVVHDTLARITAQRERIHTAGRGAGALVDAVKEFEAARTDAKKAVADPERYERDVMRCAELAAQLEQSRERQAVYQAKHAQLVHVRNAAPQLARWQELRDAIDAIVFESDSWTKSEHESFVQLTRDLATLREDIANLDIKLAAERESLEGIVVEEQLLAAGEQIAALQQRLELVRSARQGLAGFEADVITARRELATAVADAGSESIVPAPQRAELRAALAAARRADERALDAIERRAKAEDGLAAARADLEDAGGKDAADEEAALDAVYNDAQKVDIDHERTTREAATSRLEALELRARALPGCDVDLAGARALALPAAADIRTLEARFEAIESELATRQKVLADVDQHLPAKRDRLAELEREGAVPDRAQLEQLRQTRDAAWQLVRDAIVDPSGELDQARAAVPAVDAGIAGADACADDIARDSERAGEAGMIRREIVLEEQRERDARERIAELEAARRQLSDGEWTSLWAGAGVAPTSPEAMQAFTESVTVLRADATKLDADMASVSAKLSGVRALHGELGLLLGAQERGAALDHEDEFAAFERLRSLAATRRSQLGKQRELRAGAQATVTTCERDHAAATKAGDAAVTERDTCRTTLETECASTGVAFGTFDAIEARIAGHEAAERASAALAAAERSHDTARSCVEEFAADVATLVAALDPDAAQLDPAVAEATTSELASRLGSAQVAEQRRQALARQVHDLEVTARQRTASREQLEQQLVDMQERVGVANVEALAVLDASWIEREELLAEQRELDNTLRERTHLSARQLLDLRGDDDDTALAVRIDALGAKADACEQERATDTAERDQLVAAINAAETSTVVAEARQRQQQAMTRIELLVPELRRLAIQEQLLREFLEQQARESRGPLLERASGYFARITCGEFTGLDLDRDADGNGVLVAMRPNDDQPVNVQDGLSEGTADQLFLALRLAAIAIEAASGAERMPLIIDDVLMSFDDDRARATLEVFGELAERTQVVFLTHHAHLVELARRSLDQDMLAVIDVAAGDSVSE